MEDTRISPEAVVAVLRGDFKNAAIASTPGGIERQEAQGQADMVRASHLPREIGGGVSQQQLSDNWGITFGPLVDALFVTAILPTGWKLVPTEHSMHTDLVDNNGRIRAEVFYKAAFYDRRADMRVIPRYVVRTDRVEDHETLKVYYVLDNATGEQVHKGEPFPRKYWKVGEDASDLERQWLNTNYPNNRDVFAYWN